jgi:tetratricopeptide (TPR) repeat protein
MTRLIAPALAMVFLGLITGPTPVRAADAPAEKAIRAFVDRLFKAYARKDLDGFMALWSEKSPDYAVRKRTMRQLFAETGPIDLKALRVLRVVVDGASARVHFRVELAGTNPGTGELHRWLGKLDRLLVLTREGGDWQVRRYLPPEQELAERVAAAKTDEERQRLLAADKAIVDAEFVRQLNELANDQVRRGQFAEAGRLNELAFDVAREVGGKRSLARCHLARYFLLETQGRYPAALEQCRQALALFQQAQDTEGQARAQGTIGDTCQQMGRFDEAAKAYEAGLELARAAGLRDAQLSLLHNFGLLRQRQGKEAEARASYAAAGKLARELGDRVAEAKTLNNLALIEQKQGKSAEALADFEASAKLVRAANAQSLEAMVLHNLGRLRTDRKEYAEASAAYEASIKLAHQVGEQYREALVQRDLAGAWEAQKKIPEAVKACEASLGLYRELSDKRGQLETLKYLGRLYRQAGRFADAIEATEASERLEQEPGK